MALSDLVKKFKLLFLPKQRRIYVVLQGKHRGEWLVKVKKTSKEVVFFSLPDKYIHTISKNDFEFGLKNKIIESVDVLPKQVYNVCIAEYNLKVTDEQRNNTLNRWEQHSSPDILES